MNKDRFDLDADKVVLDYEGLVKTAQIAVRFSRDKLEHSLSKWHEIDYAPHAVDAEWMQEEATALAIATRTLHYLVKGSDRKEVVIKRQ